MFQAKPAEAADAYQPRHSFMRWIERRLPIGRFVHTEFVVPRSQAECKATAV
jgi:hypothetical protein